MYIVIHKETKEIVHKNPAPLKQELSDKEVYFRFDHEIHEITKGDRLPEHWKDVNGVITELTFAEKVEQNIIGVEPTQKIEDGEIVDKTEQEKVDEGLLDIQIIKENKKILIKNQLKEEMLENMFRDSTEYIKYSAAIIEIDDLENVKDINDYMV